MSKLDDGFKFSWRDRIYWWFRGHFTRHKCDGCVKGFRLNRITPVSGDCWLCDPCFRRWYPEFAEEVTDDKSMGSS